jgi:Kef-type K+ transport system membrane component KefB
VAFSLVAAAIDLASGLGGAGGLLDALYVSLYPLAWQILGSAALGLLVGMLLAAWSSKVTETGETLILLGGAILLCVGLSRVLDLSPLVASMAVGATMVNFTPHAGSLFETLSRTDPPFYAIFFVLAGADLDLGLVGSLGLAGVVYLLGRAAGKLVGARVGARWLGLGPAVRRYLGLALLAQAGLAVGLVITTQRRFADLAPAVTAIVLASVVVYEIVGPISARYALVRAGEASLHRREDLAI